MIRTLIKWLLRNSTIHTYFRRLYGELRDGAGMSSTLEVSVPEATPIECRVGRVLEPRLNLFIPALSVQHVFGGIATALEIFRAISLNVSNVRIVLTDESNFEHSKNPAFSDWYIGSLDQSDEPGRWIIPAGDRYGKSLCVSANDKFIASSWWTAVIIRKIRDWQMGSYGLPTPTPFVYLIQDYEPGFYAWSSRYALAESTYRNTQGLIPIFNTSILRDFFVSEGYAFDHEFVFEPHLNNKLAGVLAHAKLDNKEKAILVYGRPGVPRNAFELVVMGLRRWVELDPSSVDWKVISLGESHTDVELGRGVQMISKGKLGLEEYAQHLIRSSIGLSLMISPHPSYPPLEMAAFGMRVITNRYKAKDLAQIHSGIIGLRDMSPQAIAEALIFLAGSTSRQVEGEGSSSDFWRAYVSEHTGYAELREPVQKLLSLH